MDNDQCPVCKGPMPPPESRLYGLLCGAECTATARYMKLPASVWREWVAKDCVICQLPVPFERILRFPIVLTCSVDCGIRRAQRQQRKAHKRWRKKRQARARELTRLARQAAAG